jgi:hypothetical protein
MANSQQSIIAFQIHEPTPKMRLVSAPLERSWMDESPQRFAYRCLPLNIANQNGWMLLSPASFRAYWYGGALSTDIELQFDGPADPMITSHFGSGVLTFSLPYLFRTPPGINTWVKGPSNFVKDGIQALEGVVETDWSNSTFTMNWRFTRPLEWVSFQEGEPICMLVPIPRGLTESLVPEVHLLANQPDQKAKYEAWEASRRGFLEGLQSRDPEAVKRGWQKDYFQGKVDDAVTFEGHQTRLNVKEFMTGG